MKCSIGAGFLVSIGCLGVSILGAEAVPGCNPPGELTLLKKKQPNGTVAQCRHFAADGQLTKLVSYVTRDPDLRTPVQEDQLHACTIRVFQYDSQGRRIRMEARLPGNYLSAYSETRYRPDGLVTMTRYTGDGVRTGETLWWAKAESKGKDRGPVTNVTYDSRGEKVISIQGTLLEDRDLDGWGEPVKGLAFGIAPNRVYGAMGEFVIHSTVRNMTARSMEVVANESFWVLEPELRNEENEVVPVDRSKVDRKMDEMIRENGGMGDSVLVVEPSAATAWRGRFKLEDWYSPLPAGDYSFKVHRRRLGAKRELPSNSIAFTILPSSILD